MNSMVYSWLNLKYIIIKLIQTIGTEMNFAIPYDL